MSTSNQLKEYLKEEVRKSYGSIPADNEEQFERIMNAFAVAIDKYLKLDVKVEVGIHSTVDIIGATAVTITPGVLV